ncbi:MAG: hypothetical protein P4L31_00870 [Candidatus Babeliales bacterium]|nr:hypothetical protein [Candidatus Babeliales bacterium]
MTQAYLLVALVMASLCAFSAWSMHHIPGFSLFKNICHSGTYGNESVKDIHAIGSAKLDGTTVLDSTKVDGNLKAKDATLNKVNVNGSVNLEGCTINGNANINGYLEGKGNTFKGTLSVSSESVSLDSSSLQSIEIRKVYPKRDKQVVKLQNNTFIAGNITFASGDGEVLIDASSKVLGKVIGGTLIRANGSKL